MILEDLRAWVDIKSTPGWMKPPFWPSANVARMSQKKTYENALSKDLPSDVRAIVERQCQGVVQHRDRVHHLRGAVS
jgi:uncharacterized protein (TIGR02284 family)